MFSLLYNLHSPPWKVSDARSKASAGVGAFTLVRAEAFRAVDGFRHLALSVDDDMRLAQVLKYAGYRSRIVSGRGAYTVRWQVGLWGMIRGLEKNFFAGVDFRLAAAVLGVPAILVVGLGPHLGLFFGPWWTRTICAAGLGSIALLLARERGQGGIAWYHALLLPIGATACAVALARSTWLTLRRRGVRWRDHFYPIDELKAHIRQRNAWTREVWRSTR
jgi:cellulose synthase/poly-beta-1,6-N-acetylglucosamine synthase-like glycosyltransferase